LAFSFRLSAFGFRLSAVGFRLSAFGFRLSAVGYQLLVICYLLLVIVYSLRSADSPERDSSRGVQRTPLSAIVVEGFSVQRSAFSVSFAFCVSHLYGAQNLAPLLFSSFFFLSPSSTGAKSCALTFLPFAFFLLPFAFFL